MNKNNSKNRIFQCLLEELLNWYSNEIDDKKNDLSKLKVLKLLFLWVSKNEEYLKVFDNFVAWDLWPVEKDIYVAIKSNKLGAFNLSNFNLEKEQEVDFWEKAKEFSLKL